MAEPEKPRLVVPDVGCEVEIIAAETDFTRGTQPETEVQRFKRKWKKAKKERDQLRHDLRVMEQQRDWCYYANQASSRHQMEVISGVEARVKSGATKYTPENTLSMFRHMQTEINSLNAAIRAGNERLKLMEEELLRNTERPYPK